MFIQSLSKNKKYFFSINPTPGILNELKFDDKDELIFEPLDNKAPSKKKNRQPWIVLLRVERLSKKL